MPGGPVFPPNPGYTQNNPDPSAWLWGPDALPSVQNGFALSRAKTKAALNPSGANVVGGWMPQNTNKQSVGAMQQFLKNKGYNISVDGVRGPQTNAAAAAFHNHITPQAFNSRNRTQDSSTGKFVPSTSSVSPTASVRTTTSTATNATAQPTKSSIKASSASSNNSFNPWKMAQSEANAQYDPTIDALNQQISALQNEQPSNVAQINAWFNQMMNQYNSDSAAQQSATAGGLNDVAQSYGNAAQLFGASNAQQMQTPAGIASGELAGIDTAQQDFLKNMGPMLSQQAAGAIQNEQGTYNANVANLVSQLASQQQAKGQQFVSNYQQNLNDQATMQQNATALADANALLPYQIQSAAAQAKSDTANANAAGSIASATTKLDNAKVQEVQAETAKYMASAAASGNPLTPGSSAQKNLMKDLQGSMTNAQGTALIQNPLLAQQALYSEAVATGLINSAGKELVPGAIQTLKGVLQNALASNVSWRQAGWTWNGSTFVRTK